MNGEIIIDINETDFQGEAPDVGAFEYYEWDLGDIILTLLLMF